jgi:hypothetical protein
VWRRWDAKQILKPARTNIRADVFADAVQPSSFGKVGVDLAIPCSLVPLANKGRELSELLGRKRIHSRFYFRKTQLGS